MQEPVTRPRVLVIGGAPMTGKSSVARILARDFDLGIVNTDDIGAAGRALTSPTSHPELHRCHQSDYREYLSSYEPQQLLEHALSAHAALWPALEAVIRSHASWAHPAVIEGWALSPERVSGLTEEAVASVWLDVPEPALMARARADVGFWGGASNPELLLRRFIRRNTLFAARVREEAASLGHPLLQLTGGESVEEVARACARVAGIEPAAV